MISNKKISVVIPTYNEETSINNLINSLLNQTYKIDEILISDGGSSDRTIKIVKSFIEKNKKVKLIKRDGNCRGAGRNSGILNAKNQYIALIDAGTLPYANWIEELIKEIQINKNLDIVFGSVIPTFDNNFNKILAALSLGKNHTNGKLSPTVSSLLLKKTIWEKGFKFPESKKGNFIVEDLIFIEKIKSSNLKCKTNLNACVEWFLPKNYKDVFKKFHYYFYGGLFTGHAKIMPTLRNFFIYIFSFLLAIVLSNFYILIFPLLFHLFRSSTYLLSANWLQNKNIIILINNILHIFLMLTIVDISTYSALFRWLTKKRTYE